MMARTKRIYNRKTWHGYYHPMAFMIMIFWYALVLTKGAV